MVAAAIVVSGRRPGRSAWGHIGLRFLRCAQGQLHDVLYDQSRADGAWRQWMALRHPDEGWAEGRHNRRRVRDHLVIDRADDPVDGGGYAFDLARNRELWEIWLDWDPARLEAAHAHVAAAHAAELAAHRAGLPLTTPRYRPFSTNCTLIVREVAGAPGAPEGPVFPMAWLRAALEDPAARVGLHPSPHLLRAAGALDGARIVSGDPAPARRPTLRRRVPPADHKAVAAALADGAPGVGPGLLGGPGPPAGSPAAPLR